MTTKTEAATQALITQLHRINGKRRQRTISYTEAVQAIREALRDGYGYVNGGTVANCYGYAAVQTQVTAIAGNGVVVVRAIEASASKGSGTGLPWKRNATADTIAAGIEAATKTPHPGAIVLTRNTARRIVAAQDHADALAAIDRIPAELREDGTLVTAADSLAAGNCESETRRVSSWFAGRDAVPARELLAAIIERAPSLVTFAVRAVQYAQRRAVAA